DQDLIVGNSSGVSYFFLNVGNINSPKWTSFAAPSPGTYTQLAYADLDNDGDLDLLVGCSDGKSYAYQNIGSNALPSWSPKSEWDAPNVSGGYAASICKEIRNPRLGTNN
ncbi:unnamed protein product, partial [marine sediment metagenome]